MGKLFQFRTKPQKKNDFVIGQLEGLLDEARKGRFTSLIFLTQDDSGGVKYGLSGDNTAAPAKFYFAACLGFFELCRYIAACGQGPA